MCEPDNWEEFGDATIEECTQVAEGLLMSTGNAVGTIEMTVGNIPSWGLECDGSTYNKEDYPLLYDALPGVYKDLTTFTLPNFTGRFPVGGVNVGITGGESTHTLTELEMPSHEHGGMGHSHAVGQFTGEIPTPVPDVPIPDLLLGIRGGGLPHNNLPPFLTVRFYVVAM